MFKKIVEQALSMKRATATDAPARRRTPAKATTAKPATTTTLTAKAARKKAR
jgi:hypothetical protein